MKAILASTLEENVVSM